MGYGILTLAGLVVLCSTAIASETSSTVTHVFRSRNGVVVITQSGSSHGAGMKVVRGPNGITITQDGGGDHIAITQSGPGE